MPYSHRRARHLRHLGPPRSVPAENLARGGDEQTGLGVDGRHRPQPIPWGKVHRLGPAGSVPGERFAQVVHGDARLPVRARQGKRCWLWHHRSGRRRRWGVDFDRPRPAPAVPRGARQSADGPMRGVDDQGLRPSAPVPRQFDPPQPADSGTERSTDARNCHSPLGTEVAFSGPGPAVPSALPKRLTYEAGEVLHERPHIAHNVPGDRTSALIGVERCSTTRLVSQYHGVLRPSRAPG